MKLSLEDASEKKVVDFQMPSITSAGQYGHIAFVTMETVLLYSNFIMYKALATDAILVKTWTRGH